MSTRARKKPLLSLPTRNLYATVAWDTWWPEAREVLVFESKRAALDDAKRIDPGWRATVYPITLGDPIRTEDGEPCAPYDEDEDAAA